MTIIEKARIWRRKIEQLADDGMDDAEALEYIDMFEEWNGNGVEYREGKRLKYNETLYRVRQNHTSQSDWTPDITSALYVEVAEEGQGTKDNPIPYNNNMELEEGKYYTQFDVLYYCFRSSGVAVYNNLADLVNLYVNVVEE